MPLTEIDLLNEISNTLTDIRDLLANRNAQTRQQPPPLPSAKWERGPDDEINVPQPSRVVHRAEEIEVHFGKNKGRPLGELSASSLSWYAAKWAPKPRDDGSLWPNDGDLLAAARTLWHEKQKTLRGSAIGDKATTIMNAPKSSDVPVSPSQRPMPATVEGDEEVPF